MLLIKSSLRHSIARKYPIHFRERWIAVHKVDPLDREFRKVQLNVFMVFALAVGVLFAVAAGIWGSIQPKQEDGWVRIMGLGVGFLFQGAAAQGLGSMYADPAVRFQEWLGEIAGYLGRSRVLLYEMETGPLQSIALGQMLRLGAQVLCLNDNFGREPDLGKDLILVELKKRYAVYRQAGLVPDGGEDGWKAYLKPRK